MDIRRSRLATSALFGLSFALLLLPGCPGDECKSSDDCEEGSQCGAAVFIGDRCKVDGDCPAAYGNGCVSGQCERVEARCIPDNVQAGDSKGGYEVKKVTIGTSGASVEIGKKDGAE